MKGEEDLWRIFQGRSGAIVETQERGYCLFFKLRVTSFLGTTQRAMEYVPRC